MQGHRVEVGHGAPHVAVLDHAVVISSCGRSRFSERVAAVDAWTDRDTAELTRRLWSTDARRDASDGIGVALETTDGLWLAVAGSVAVEVSGPGAAVRLGPGGDWCEQRVPSGSHIAFGSAEGRVELVPVGPAPAPTIDVRSQRTTPADGPLVLGRHCPLGHFNPPQPDLCRVCREHLGGAPLVRDRCPPLAALTFSDGQRHLLTRSLVVGRRPSPASHDGRRECDVLTVNDDEKMISRNHFEVSVAEWDLRVIDRGSRNGTRVRRSTGGDIALRVGESAMVQLGDVIFFGDASATVTEADI
jgi:hypothetical protein